ncbi:MAG: hypothetical protein H0V01_11810 [Bacteroidetes bacterium]|nr:hypothetical protein [Bacteroidota bacterium]HET6245739.1 hypothetical protein [Bacteroidia bacterium]
MKKFIFFFVFLGIVSISFGQDSDKKGYNLPPGTVFNPKTYKKIDYSYKLNGVSNNAIFDVESTNLLSKYTEEELFKIKISDPASYNYYTSLKKYHENLSQKVKTIYTLEELSYIYVFDQELKNRLQNIK